MPELICIDGMVIRLTASATWGWGTSTVSSPSFGNYIDVTVSGTGNKLTINGTTIVLEGDITSAMSSVSDSYHASPNFGVFANVSPLTTGTDGTVANVTLTSGLTPSTIHRHDTNGVILETLSGNFSIPVTVPANAPIPPPPVGTPTPDTITPKTGTWAIQNNGGNTIYRSD